MRLLMAALVVVASVGCGAASTPGSISTPALTPSSPTAKPTPSKAQIPTSAPSDELKDMTVSGSHANVELVSVSGGSGSYSFSVTVRSPDTGCERYADWWEVLSSEGQLIFRRVLLHSHASEQPFTRSGGPVNVGPEETIIVRAHMNDTGYGGVALRGSVVAGFTPMVLLPEFARDVEEQQPKPQGCAF